MQRHLAQNLTRRSKRHLNMNEFISSPSFHHIHDRKQPRLCQQEELNQKLNTKCKHSLSYTSLNSYLKEFNLSEKDYVELRQALKRIFYYLQPKIDKQRLMSPYLQQQLIDDDQSSLPLYTNEYFIRNGLLNHNDGPDIFSSTYSKPIFRFESSSMNISLPLELLSNQRYLLTALTSNFAAEKPKRSQSSMGLKYHSDNETGSMIIRRKKVQTWERENILQQKMSIAHSSIEQDDQIEASEYHRGSFVRTPSIDNDEKITDESNSSSLRTFDQEKGNDKLLKMKNTDDLFPLVKKLGRKSVICKKMNSILVI
jgi:hypothetical protein